jgi:hypothetical protein
MSKPFTDLNLTDEEISKNYTWQQIKNNQEYADSKVFDDLDRNLLVVSNQDNTLDQTPGLNDNIVVGTGINVIDTNNSVSIGHHMNIISGNDIIKIGGAESETENDDILSSNQCVSIGINNTMNTSADCISIGFDSSIQGNINLVIGSANDVVGNNNILIGDDIFFTHSNMSNNTIISIGQIPAVPAPANGSLIFGGSTGSNNPPAADARIQFLSNNLVAAGAGAAFPGSYDAYIPIRYRGANYRIPVLNDS